MRCLLTKNLLNLILQPKKNDAENLLTLNKKLDYSPSMPPICTKKPNKSTFVTTPTTSKPCPSFFLSVTSATGYLSKKKRFNVSSFVSIVISQNLSPFFNVLCLSPTFPGDEGRVRGFAGDKSALRRGESGG